MVAQLRQFVECESPSYDPSAVNRFVELVSDTVAPFGKVKTFGRHLVCEVQLPGRKKSGQVMALGHSDTVWPVGTLRTMPFRQADGRLWGPGVLDMKAGIVSEFEFDTSQLYLMSSSSISCFATWIRSLKALQTRCSVDFKTNPNLDWQRRTLDPLRRLAIQIVSID